MIAKSISRSCTYNWFRGVLLSSVCFLLLPKGSSKFSNDDELVLLVDGTCLASSMDDDEGVYLEVLLDGERGVVAWVGVSQGELELLGCCCCCCSFCRSIKESLETSTGLGVVEEDKRSANASFGFSGFWVGCCFTAVEGADQLKSSKSSMLSMFLFERKRKECVLSFVG